MNDNDPQAPEAESQPEQSPEAQSQATPTVPQPVAPQPAASQPPAAAQPTAVPQPTQYVIVGYDADGIPQYAPYTGQQLPPLNHPKRRRYTGLIITGAAVVAIGIGATGVGLGTALSALQNSSSSSSAQGSTGSGSSGSGSGSSGTYGNGGFGPNTGTTSVNATAATAAQKVGVVTVLSTLDYDSNSQAAGTGIIYSSNGEILTNNHVVQGSTSIKVTIESTNKTYTAKVIGTDATDDIAVLQLVDSSGSKVTGLTTAKIDKDTLSTGDAVTSIGNAEGTGNLVAAAGSVTALNQSIQVANDETGATENLTGLIETNADVVSGDSGGPLIDAQGEVTGVVTAASSGSRNVAGYAIPITTAVTIAKKIIAGEASSTITIGLPAFLGVELATTQSGTGQSGTTQTGTGALIGGIVSGSPASGTGLAAGDTITAVNGSAVTSGDSLSALIKSHAVGDQITVTYTDASGASQQVTVTLTGGPAA